MSVGVKIEVDLVNVKMKVRPHFDELSKALIGDLAAINIKGLQRFDAADCIY